MPTTNGITDPDDPRIAARNEVLDRLEAGELTLAAAATEMGVSTTWARKLRDDRRHGGVDPARLRKDMLDRRLRPIKDRVLEPVAERLARHVGANTVTGVELASTLGAASLAASGRRLLALGAWLLGRLLDGLDGAVAGRRNEASDYGGYLTRIAAPRHSGRPSLDGRFGPFT